MSSGVTLRAQRGSDAVRSVSRRWQQPAGPVMRPPHTPFVRPAIPQRYGRAWTGPHAAFQSLSLDIALHTRRHRSFTTTATTYRKTMRYTDTRPRRDCSVDHLMPTHAELVCQRTSMHRGWSVDTAQDRTTFSTSQYPSQLAHDPSKTIDSPRDFFRNPTIRDLVA
jgi:hypothetical protein